jgi:hypothetical protein
MTRPSESVCIAVIDAIVSMPLDDDGTADRKELETTAIRREEFAKQALSRYCEDYPVPGSEGATYNAITDGLLLLGNDAVAWLLSKGHLVELALGRIGWGRPMKVGGKPYLPGAAREEDLWHSIRRVTPKRLELIRESMTELGDLREYFPVLKDVEGNVVDGRHRLAIDENWPAMRIKVPLAQRVAAAVAANRSNAWTAEDWQRLRHHREMTHGKHNAVQWIARMALLEDHERSNSEIARTTGVDDKVIARIRKEMEETSVIPSWITPKGGRPRSDGTPAQPRSPASKATPALIAELENLMEQGAPVPRSALAAKYDVGESVVQDEAIAARGRKQGREQAEQERQERVRVAAEAAEQERQRNQHLLAEWRGYLDKTVQEYREAPAVVLDDLLRRLTDLRRAL